MGATGRSVNFKDVDLSSLVYVAHESPLRAHPTVKADWSEPTRIYGNTETFTLSSAYVSGTPEEVIATISPGRSSGVPPCS